MGTVHALAREAVTLAGAIDAYELTLAAPESAATLKSYRGVLRPLAAGFGHDALVAALDARAVAASFTAQWGTAAPGTWNVRLTALRSACAYWRAQGWLADDPVTRLRPRRRARDRSRALARADVERLLTREDIALRERVLWRMLYETAARSAEVLRLDVEDLDLPNRRAKVRRKGGAIDVIVWQTGTARLLPRLLKGRKTGPVFLTDRRARVEVPPGDIDPASGRARLSYRQAEDLFKAAAGGATLHPLRHSALTHEAEDGASTPMLMAKSGHTSVASPARRGRPPRPWPAGRPRGTRHGGGSPAVPHRSQQSSCRRRGVALPPVTAWCTIRLLRRSGLLRRVGPAHDSGRAERS